MWRSERNQETSPSGLYFPAHHGRERVVADEGAPWRGAVVGPPVVHQDVGTPRRREEERVLQRGAFREQTRATVPCPAAVQHSDHGGQVAFVFFAARTQFQKQPPPENMARPLNHCETYRRWNGPRHDGAHANPMPLFSQYHRYAKVTELSGCTYAAGLHTTPLSQLPGDVEGFTTAGSCTSQGPSRLAQAAQKPREKARRQGGKAEKSTA